MSFDSGLQYYDRSNNYKLYVYQSGAWHEMSALWDGSTVTSGTVTTLNSTTVNATSATIGLLSGTTLTGFTTIAGTYLSGTLLNYSQPNVTDVGALTGLDVNGYSDITVTGSTVGLKVGGSHASFASELQQLVTTRANSSSFKFLVTRSSAGGDVEHNLRGDGNGYCDGAWTGGGADFAEFMEWEDGNPLDDDRTGRTVAIGVQDITGHITPKIKIAEISTTVAASIIGVPKNLTHSTTCCLIDSSRKANHPTSIFQIVCKYNSLRKGHSYIVGLIHNFFNPGTK